VKIMNANVARASGMSRWLLFAALLAAFAHAGPAEDDHTQLSRIERDLANALLKGEVAVWDRHVSPDLLFTNPGGRVHDAKQATEGLRSEQWLLVARHGSVRH
jgi:hypothetical protein